MPKKKISLQRYWTTRYLLTIIIGLVIMAIVSALWIRHTTLENRLHMLEFMAEETANRLVANEEPAIPPLNEVPGLFSERGDLLNMESNPSIYITDSRGAILANNRPQSPLKRFDPTLLNNPKEVIKLSEKGYEPFYMVKKPIEFDSVLLGWVVITETQANLSKVNQEYQQLTIMIVSLALIGWAAVYILSRKLSKPIKEVSKAAEQVRKGNYEVDLPSDAKAEEVDELIHSFKEMSQQLQKLESLRTELLAGVTHELKTPVTSISGLLQAIDEEVVSGEEAKEFLEISLKETAKMRTMVEDLLAFNSFAANAVPLTMEEHSINELVKESVYQWEAGKPVAGLTVEVKPLQDDASVRVDGVRLQQIMTNLLNNAGQAMALPGKIEVIMNESQSKVMIDIKDTGTGIPQEEQSFIFERFYRGQEKKYKVGGLGLGLPYSKMMAQAMNGDLELIESTSSGTTFRISLPKTD
ncbi:HAMP domain-containing sensor histidine kinase [Siminovitchia fortis]|nr:HAMP domain-containing sensor histidine kinase [Siminovitchia fortis]WHY83769.1 HAMP domain-containing sensor histidine kinase [Siminovitchia fortis]